MRYLLPILFLCLSCAKDRVHDESSGNIAPAADLRVSFDHWLVELRGISDPDNGWPSVVDCDALLWAGLASAAGHPVQIHLAEDQPGHWQRRPTPCWTPGEGDVGSRSTISGDMLTGLLWHGWRAKDYALFQRLAMWGEAHEERAAGVLFGWVMGEPYPAETGAVVIRQNLYGVIGRILLALSAGADDRSYRHEGTLYTAGGADYQEHLTALGILLQGETSALAAEYGLIAITDQELDVLRSLAKDHPADALFQTALAVYTGDFVEAGRLLRDPGYQCPSYVRGSEAYCLVHKVFAAHLVLKYNGGQ